MIVTTALKQVEKLEPIAKQVSVDLNGQFVPRKKKGLNKLRGEYNEDIMIVGQDILHYLPKGESEPFFFHPNMAKLRYKRLVQGKEDPLILASQLEVGMSFLDCTLGLAADSIIASIVIGEKGRVLGVEGHPILAYIVKHGLQNIDSEEQIWYEALKRIEVIQSNHFDVLCNLESDTFDVVYFDPMFDHTIDESIGIKPLKTIALYETITKEVITEALRVAKRRVVIKDHWKSSRFDEFGFQVIKRPTSLFHYGYLEKHWYS